MGTTNLLLVSTNNNSCIIVLICSSFLFLKRLFVRTKMFVVLGLIFVVGDAFFIVIGEVAL